MLFSERLDALPAHLAERTRVLKDAPDADPAAPPPGNFILYWMHHAARAHENPALDTAIHLANNANLPVLVYQGLAGNHRFNADRHHVFIMQGAAVAARDLANHNIRHAFHLPADPSRPSPLRELADRAAAVICEDFPAPPFPKWTEALAARTDTPTIAVDACCVVPMQSLGNAYDRAFKFRSKAQRLFDARVHQQHDTPQPNSPIFNGTLPFQPLHLTAENLRERAASCDIDHTLPPVDELPGGSDAGYQRWQAFISDGLAAYAKRRNNAAIHGVSRLSPYLHHGHVAPTRIAREAAAMSGDGPAKFIDELFVWREMAHNFCFYNATTLDTLDAIPKWARDTLASHTDDPRDTLLTWEDLARARSGDRLWDAAQRSLLVRGELHNNIRMTWAKAIVAWTRGPREAHDNLIDLNHRLALDGNDPNSYGGLLWALGAFDRPFKPEQPVFGTVRTRDTRTHADRLDLDRYERKIAPPPHHARTRVAVIGAGFAGSYAARALADQGFDVVAFDKARGPGGRSATRFTDGVTFDHGAQYLAVRSETTRKPAESWRNLGILERWDAKFVNIDDDGAHDRGPITRFVGVPTMNAIVEHLQRDLAVRFNTRITHLERAHDAWTPHSEDGPADDQPFDLLVVALPQPQASELLTPASPELCARINAATMDPTWTLMLGLSEPVQADFDAARVSVSGSPLAWISRDNSKPGRDVRNAGLAQTWCIHGSREWSREHLEDDPDDVADALLDAFKALLRTHIRDPAVRRAHRWRYSLTADALDEPAPCDREAGIVVTGDWCVGGTIEAAIRSGNAAAGRAMALAADAKRAATNA